MLKYFYETVSVLIGILILLVNYFFISQILPIIIPFVNMIGALIAVIPPLFVFYSRFKTKRELEVQFLAFINDLTDAIKTGMTLPLALENCSKRNYMALSPYVNDLASQVNWGIPFEKALKIFAKRIGLITVKRAVTTIIETYKMGGKIGDTMIAVGRSLMTIDKIKKERSTSVHAQIITSYLIFFVFIFILVVLRIFLIPALMEPTVLAPGAAIAPGTPVPTEIFTESFVNFIVIQGFFAGLVTGKMAEGSVIAGFKHSVLLIVIGYTIFAMASQFQVKIF